MPKVPEMLPKMSTEECLWDQEVWIFGDALVEEFERIDRQLGWMKRSGADWRMSR